MTNINRIVIQGALTSLPFSEYVGKANELTLDTDTGQLYFQDGVTPGGNPVGGASLTITDGTNTVEDVTNITVTGGTVGGTLPDATLTIAGGATGPTGPAGDTGPTGPSGVGAIAFVVLSTDDLLAASVTGIEIIPSPGGGQGIVVVQSVYSYFKGSTTYSGGPGGLYYDGIGGAELKADADGDSSVCTSSSTSVSFGGPAAGLEATTTHVANKGIYYLIPSGNTPYTLGIGGTLNITVAYFVAEM